MGAADDLSISLAKFFKLSLEEFEKITDNNFFNLFTKAKRDNYL